MLSSSNITVENESNITDERTFLQRIRRNGLYRIIRANGHKISEDMSAHKLRNYIIAYEDQIDFSKVHMWKDKTGQINVDRPDFLKAEEQTGPVVKITEAETSFEDMKFTELKSLASKRGINTHKMKKADILAALAV